jgi:glycosyltransferase involved in cell wall biosynthesis
MKIFLPFKIRDIGGTATFAQKFSDAAKKNGINVLNSFSSDFDTLFIIADCSLWYPIIAKILRKKIVQRLDGVYHPATPAGKWYPIYNLKMQIIHNFLADVVIYQSEFSKLSCEKFLGKIRAAKTAIIYNGVDTERIPKKTTSHSDGAPTKLLTFAKFRRRDQIEPIIESVKLLDSKKFTLDIYGSYTENLKGHFENLPDHILLRGKKSNEEMLQILHQYDIFLFSDQSACPNSVIEAMAAGLPVAAFNRGSIPELIKPGYNGEIANVRENTDSFMDIYPFGRDQFKTFSNAIKKISEAWNGYTRNSTHEVSERFKLNTMMENYLNTLKR